MADRRAHVSALPQRLFAAGLLLVAAQAAAAPADDLKALLEQGKPAEAYAEGRAHPELLGDPSFDFFFGIAALDTGHAGEGVLALERYLLNFPDNTSARLQLARGYYLLGDDARAREEFEALRALNPPPDIAATIERYLDAIRLRETRYTPSGGAYIELGLGSDSNVNSGPTIGSTVIPALSFLGPLPVGGQKQSDTFASIAGAGYYSYPVRPGIALFANGQGERKFNSSDINKPFELGNYNVAGGVSVLREQDLYRFGVNYGLLTLGTPTYRTATGASVEWQRQLDELQSVSVGVQGAQLSYSDSSNYPTNSLHDADLWGMTASYKRQFSHSWAPVLTLGVNAANQHSRDGHPELVPNSRGVGASVNVTPAAKWGASLGYLYMKNDYQGIDTFAAPDARHDRYDAYDVGVTYLYSRNISLRAEALLSRNSSNADVYSFSRDIYTVKVRYEFK